MRVCQVMLAQGFGGGERSFVDTVLALADRGHPVQAICHRDFVKRSLLEAHPGVLVSPVSVRGAWDLFATGRIQREMARFGPDVVQVHLARAAHLGGRAARRLAVPVVAKTHNYVNLKYYRDVDGFITTTPDQQRYLRERGIATGRIEVIPNFSRIPAQDAGLLETKSRQQDAVHIVSCGRLHAVKGFDILLQAMAELQRRRVPVRLTIAGDGPERERLEELRRSLALEQCVEFTGWIDDPQTLLDLGDLYVLSSRSESFGISLLEAMARGLPIVSTRCQGPMQLLSEEQCWYADVENPVSLADALQAAIVDPRRRLASGAELRREYLEKYWEPQVVPRLLEFYRHCGAADTPRDENGQWPDDYRRIRAAHLDHRARTSDELVVRRDALEAMRSKNWTSAGAVIDSDAIHKIRDTNGRDNCRVELPGSAGRLHGYLKRHWVNGPFLFWTRERQPPGVAEALAVAECQRAGVPAMSTLATGWRDSTSSRRSVRESFYLSETLPGKSGFEVVMNWNQDGRSGDPDVRESRLGMIRSAARAIRRMHNAGLFHQDLYWTHLYFQATRSGDPEVRLIDLQRLRRPPAFAHGYYWWKDMEQIRFSMQRMRFNQEDIETWYACYFQGRAHRRVTLSQRLLTLLIRLRGARRAVRMAWRRQIPSPVESLNKNDATSRAA